MLLYVCNPNKAVWTRALYWETSKRRL